jgi:hypothetical protein
VAMAAVPELVDGGSLVAAYALFEHARETAGGLAGLRPRAVLLVGKPSERPGRRRRVGLTLEGRDDRGTLLGRRLRADLELHRDTG